MSKWAHIENIAIVAVVGVLCWHFENGWAALMLAFVNVPKELKD